MLFENTTNESAQANMDLLLYGAIVTKWRNKQ